MQSALSAMKIKRKNDIFRKHYDNAIEALKHGESIRVPTNVAKGILLNYPTIEGLPTFVRNIGAGIKELYVKEVS